MYVPVLYVCRIHVHMYVYVKLHVCSMYVYVVCHVHDPAEVRYVPYECTCEASCTCMYIFMYVMYVM